MSLRLRAGRLTIDQAGRSVFDTDDKLYHDITSNISGSLTIPARTASSSKVLNIDTDHYVGTCNPFCTHLAGSVKFRGGSNAMPVDVWHAYEGGSIFWVLSKFVGFTSSPYRIYTANIVKYEFRISGSNVILNERVYAKSAVSFTILAHAIDWKLKAGRFT